MSPEQRLARLEQVFGAADGPTPEQRRILNWLSIWRLTPQKRSYLQQHAPSMIELAEPLQGILEDPDEQAAFLGALAAQGITSLEGFLNHLHHQAHH